MTVAARPEASGAPAGPAPDAPVAAIDVGGTRIKAALVRADGTELHAIALPTPADIGARLGTEVAAIVDQLTALSGQRPAAVGLAVPGIVDDERGVGVASANLGWRDLDLVNSVAAATRLPVASGHDVRAGLAAEAWLGAAVGARDALFVPVGTGIAAAAMVDGRVLSARGYAGEIGHVVIDLQGQPCGCGNRGCLETIASARAIGRAYGQRTGVPDADAALVAQRVAAGDAHAIEVWELAVDTLARVLATAAAMCGTDLVIIGGGLANAGPVLTAPLAEGLQRYIGSRRPMRLVRAELGERAGCLGAARFALTLLERA